MTPESTPLPPFDPQPRCPKCGWAGATCVYSEATHVHQGYQHGNLCEVGCLPEHIGRTCGRCGFQWDEAVVNP